MVSGRIVVKVVSFAVALLFASSLQAALITFDGIPSAGNPILGAPVFDSGFSFGSSHFHTIDSPAIFGGADNGSPVYLGEEDGSLGVDIVMSQLGGGAFSFSQFDGAELFVAAPGGFPNATSILVTGALSGGGSVSATFALDGIVDGAGGAADFQTFFLPGSFTNLTSVTFSGLIGSSGTGGLGIDNIVVDTVPEPSTVFLLGLGLTGILARRRLA